MNLKKKEPDKVIRVCSREFRLYKYYDESSVEELLNLPNFAENPEYTDGGRPFVLAVQESCEHGRDNNDPDDPDPGDCAKCTYFYRNNTPYDPIGVCMCESNKLSDVTLNSKETK